MVRALLLKKGIEPAFDALGFVEEGLSEINEFKDRQYNLLAEHLRASLDMDYIYKVLDEGLGQDRKQGA
jgi:cobyric acid synthase